MSTIDVSFYFIENKPVHKCLTFYEKFRKNRKFFFLDIFIYNIHFTVVINSILKIFCNIMFSVDPYLLHTAVSFNI